MPLEGFKKMIDTINALNRTTPTQLQTDKGIQMNFVSIIYAGSGNAANPELLTKEQSLQAQTEIVSYLREKHQVHGLYFALGQHDLFSQPSNI